MPLTNAAVIGSRFLTRGRAPRHQFAPSSKGKRRAIGCRWAEQLTCSSLSHRPTRRRPLWNGRHSIGRRWVFPITRASYREHDIAAATSVVIELITNVRLTDVHCRPIRRARCRRRRYDCHEIAMMRRSI